MNVRVNGPDTNAKTEGTGHYLDLVGIPMVLYSMTVWNNALTEKYLLLFDLPEIPSNPIEGFLGNIILVLAPRYSTCLDYPAGRLCPNGIYIVQSTTVPDLTTDTEANLIIDLQYRRGI